MTGYRHAVSAPASRSAPHPPRCRGRPDEQAVAWRQVRRPGGAWRCASPEIPRSAIGPFTREGARRSSGASRNPLHRQRLGKASSCPALPGFVDFQVGGQAGGGRTVASDVPLCSRSTSLALPKLTYIMIAVTMAHTPMPMKAMNKKWLKAATRPDNDDPAPPQRRQPQPDDRDPRGQEEDRQPLPDSILDVVLDQVEHVAVAGAVFSGCR